MKKPFPISRRLAIFLGLFKGARMFIGVIHVPFVLQQGLTLPQYALTKTVYSVTLLLMQMPTGLLADLVSCQLVALLSCLCIIPYYLLVLKAPSLPYLITGEVLHGLGMCLMYGASHSWLLDTVEAEYPNQPAQIDYYGHFRKEVVSISCMLTGPLGALIGGTLGYHWAYFFACMAMGSVLVGFVTIPNIAPQKQRGSRHNVRLVSTGALKALLSTAVGRFYLFSMALLVAAWQPLSHFWQPFLRHFLQVVQNVPPFLKHELGLFSCYFFLTNVMTYGLNRYVRKRIMAHSNPFAIGMGLSILLGGLFLFLGLGRSQSLVAYFLALVPLHGLLAVLSTIVEDQYFKKAPRPYLASIVSLTDIFQRVTGTGVLMSIGAFLTAETLRPAFASCSLLMIAIAGGLFCWQSFSNISQKDL